MGVLYAVLLAFAVIVVWEKFAEADNDVATEAGAAVTIYRLADGMGGEPGAALHEAITAYLEVGDRRGLAGDGARGGEPRPRRGRSMRSMRGCCASSRRTSGRRWYGRSALPARPADPGAARAAGHGSGIVPGIVWVVLFFGAFVTIGFTFFFGTENLRGAVADDRGAGGR